MRPELPTGTVTFLFTDVEGSTKLLHALGAQAYAAELAEHRRVIRDACVAEGGVEVDTQGDAFFFAFRTAAGALAAASAFTEGLALGPITVRVGLHTGTPLLTEEGYIGYDVHFGARVASAGHGGQVILSAATAELVDDPLTDLGEHRLKDIAEAVSIFQLGEGSYPPLKTISNTNLPRPASSFIGRERELAEVVARIEAGARLLTLTGPGGSGKTRLSIEAAATLVPSYRSGVFWVGLASLRDPGLVRETISQTLGAKNGLASHIGEREMLLLLDNLEQVIEAAPGLSTLLSDCPNLALLVTSRELLRISGEMEYSVPPLAAPEAVYLFCERSQLEPSEEIAELCARLDDLPLAVELAAARTKALSPAQILGRLSQRLDLLKGGRDADPRQQTLRATIEWSYELLSADEQRLFARLSVFAGGCSLEAAEEVCDADLDTVQSLVEKSLVRFTEERYWMLETIREYAGELLHGSGYADALGQSHATYMSQMMERRRGAADRGDPRTLDEIATELDNVRAALAWLGDHGHDDAQFDLADAVGNFWNIRGGWSEALRWIDAYLATAPDKPETRRVEALLSASSFARFWGDTHRAKSYAERSLAMSQALANPNLVARAMRVLGVVLGDLGEYGRAERLLEQGIALAEHEEEPIRLENARLELGKIALNRGEFDRAIAVLEPSLVVFRELADVEGIAYAQYLLALAFFRTQSGEEALAAGEESLTICREMSDVLGCAWNLVLLGALAARRGDPAVCARLVGAADALLHRSDAALTGIDLDLRVMTEQEMRRQLDDEQYEAAFSRGKAMSLDDAVDLALASLD